MDNKCFGSERQISSFAALGELLAHPQKQPQIKKKTPAKAYKQNQKKILQPIPNSTDPHQVLNRSKGFLDQSREEV